MSKKKTIEIVRNAKTQKNEYFVENYDVTESVEYLLTEVKRDYEFKKQVELQCGLCASNDILNKQARQYKNKIADLEEKLAKMTEKYNACQEARELENEFSQQDKKELKEQLAEKEKKLAEYKRSFTIAHVEDLQIENMLLKSKDQDKISFAVEKLKKLKNRLSSMQWCFTGRRNFLQEVEFMRKSQEEMIDEEIEDLLKEKK